MSCNATSDNCSAGAPGNPSAGAEPAVLFAQILVPSIHVAVMVVGLLANARMVREAARRCGSKDLQRQRPGSTLGSRNLCHCDYVFVLIGLSDMTTLSATPLWLAQTVTGSWIFGNFACKAMKGAVSFTVQYSIFLMVYVSVERYMMVVRGTTTFARVVRSKGEQARRRVASLLCACLPLLSAAADVYNNQTVEAGGGALLCTDPSAPAVRAAFLWIRFAVCFLPPCAVLATCYCAVVCTVRRHARGVSSAFRGQRSLTGPQVLPLVTVVFFLCCWIPWLVTNAHYLFNPPAARNFLGTFLAFNLSLAAGNSHCITTPVLYLRMRARKSPASRPLPRLPSSASQIGGAEAPSLASVDALREDAGPQAR